MAVGAKTERDGEDGDAIRMDCFWHPTPAFKQPLADFKYGPKKKMTNDPHGVNSGADAMALPCTMIQKRKYVQKVNKEMIKGLISLSLID